MKSAACFLLTLAGCGSSLLGVNTDSDSGAPVDGGDASGNDGAGDDGGDAASGVAPAVSYAQAVCESRPSPTWFFTAAADDPQGIETIESGGLIHVMQEGVETAELGMVCVAATGLCSAEFPTDVVGVPCERADAAAFQFTVFDEEGHPSPPFSVNGSAS
jgi:hypothetical protein